MAGFLPRLFSSMLPRVRPFTEMGVSGTPVYAGYVLTPERSPKLIGQQKYRTYSQILSNTSIVAAGTRYFLNIVAKPSWSFEPADDSAEAKQMAEFAEEVFGDLHTPWQRIVRRCGTYRFQGFSIQEWTAKKRDDGKIGFDDIESRPQWTIWRWEVDERGTVTGAWQRDPLTGRELGLPRGKLMYIVDDTLTDSPEGMGILRHCVEPAERLAAYLKQEGFGFLRDLHGVPMGRAPMDELAAAVKAGNMSQAQMDSAIDKLKQFCALEAKTNDTAIVLNSQPYIDATDSGNTVSSVMKWGVDLIGGDAPGLQQVGEAIVRLNTEMARVLGVEHLLLGADAAGSYALAKEKATDLYLLANSVLADIAEQAEHDLLWPLWKLNGFKDELMPNMKHEDVQPKDAEQIGRVLRDMATAGAPLQPDDEVQNFVRDLLGAPKVDLNQLQERMNEEIQSQQAMLPAPGGRAGKNNGRQPTPAQEDAQDARDAKAAEKRLVAKAAFAKRLVNNLIAKSSNGNLPELRQIRDGLDDILEKVGNPNHDEHGRFSSGIGEKEFVDWHRAGAPASLKDIPHGSPEEFVAWLRADGDTKVANARKDLLEHWMSQLNKAEWDESKHPRDHGKFSHSPGSDEEKASDEQRSKLEALLDKAKKAHGAARPVLGLVAAAIKEHMVGAAVNAALSSLSGGGVETEEAGVTKARLEHGVAVAAELARRLRSRILHGKKEEDVTKAVAIDWNKEFADALDGLLTEEEAEAILKALVDTLPADAVQRVIGVVDDVFDPDSIEKAAFDESKHPKADFTPRRKLKNAEPRNLM